ncbi:hypothetical protein J437_LFUL002367 [Ladona fulva]|uniref:Uncharacterized protein n=1 Tax=Ladona fulva TaxID=123851 RepID=A0A8K0NZT6_LADFU|nr:hypothetical protein J437_LFUL002367 [Ladona fulva]
MTKHSTGNYSKLRNPLYVVNRRSQVAPFLLPPLKVKYTIGDVTDFQDDLFFSHALVRRHFNLSLAKQAEETELTEQKDVLTEQTEVTEQDKITEQPDVTKQNEVTD